jgi:hypothetical protein
MIVVNLILYIMGSVQTTFPVVNFKLPAKILS